MQHILPLQVAAWMVLKRLWHNRRLAAALALGFAVAVGIVTSVPLFTAGALTRVLAAEFAQEAAQGKQPASVSLIYYAKDKPPATAAQVAALDEFLDRWAADILGVPMRRQLRLGALDITHFDPADPTRVNPGVARWLSLAFVRGAGDYLQILDGRLYRPGVQEGGAIEAIVPEPMLDKYDFVLGAEFLAPVSRAEGATRVKVRVVGVYRPVDRSHPLSPLIGWLDQAVLVDEATFRDTVLRQPGAQLQTYTWHLEVDPADVNLANVETFAAGIVRLEARAVQMVPEIQVFHSPLGVVQRFARKAALLRLYLLALSAPLLCLTAYYLLVTAQRMVEGQRWEIALLRSRGASLAQVVGMYLLEAAVYGGAALALGPWLGVALARVMGAAAGFMQFVDRKPLPLVLDSRVWTYALGAVTLAAAAILVPAVQAARESAVTYKAQAARQRTAPFWQRYFLDLLLLAVSLYGYYTQRRQFAARLQAPPAPPGQAPEGPSDPLHFLLPALFIAALGLVALRLLPVLAALLDRAARRLGGTAPYLAITQVARSPHSTAPIVLLLTLTVGLGVYSASAARTLDQNDVDRAYYQVGADAALVEAWQFDEATNSYEEPPFHVHQSLPGVEAAARVYVARDAVAISEGGKVIGRGRLMAVDTQEFARVAWFRRDLFGRHHPFAYLNLLGRDEEAVLVNLQFLRRNQLQPGDRITLRTGTGEARLVVYGAVAYWPTLYPGQEGEGDFFVANLDYIQNTLGLRPYQVWLRLQPGASLRAITDELRRQGIYVIQAQDARYQITQTRRDPQRTGLYGVLTVGFLVAAALTVLGFLIHTALSLRQRVLQMGVLRAMGLSAGQLLGALALEQVWTVGSGVAAGTGLGLLAARLFLPFLQLGTAAAERIPPFRLVTDPGDLVRLYAVLAGMLLAGLAYLGALVSRLQIHQAVKLGEDA